jgi:hypothetical protein
MLLGNAVMKSALLSAVIAAGVWLAPFAYGQTATTTATVTATCKDGTDFSGTTRSGACRGHKGVASWGTADASPGTASTAQQAAPAKSAAGASGASGTASAKQGAPGQVWVNSASKVYHCPGDRYYGKTKAGEFMSQSAAVAAGAHPSGGKACPS